MRRHKLNWIWIILLGLFVGSCEDYLDRSPDDGLSEDDVYKDYSSLLGFMDRIFQNDDILIFTHGINSYSNTYVTVGNLSDEYASVRDKIRWTEETKDIANVPRLSTLNNANNFQSSTQWLVNGECLKLRNLNVYYDLPKNWISKIKLEQCRIFASANNVFSLDHVKYMNCEDFSVNYPDMFSVYFGASIKF